MGKIILTGVFLSLNFQNPVIAQRERIVPEIRQNSTAETSVQTSTDRNNVDEKKGDKIASKPKRRNEEYIPGEVLVKFKRNYIKLENISDRNKAVNIAQKRGFVVREYLQRDNITLLEGDKTEKIENLLAKIKADPEVEYAEPNYLRFPSDLGTNDSYKNNLWGLENTGQFVNGTIGTNDADIDAKEAWNYTSVTNTIIVAIIDDGVAYNHPDLTANMWDGSSCKNENGSYLGGCQHGYDFKNNDKIPLPDEGSHGTHIAGTIAAVKNNNKGIAGVASNVKIMAVKFGFNISSLVKAIDFARENGAKIINASFGSYDYSSAEYDAIKRFQDAGGIFVAAAGNHSLNNDDSQNDYHYYPSDLDLNNIISVAATTQSDGLAYFSNYGSASVDVGAPGVNIYSTIATQSAIDEDFNNVALNTVGNNFVKLGDATNYWGTLAINSSQRVLYTDSVNANYAPNNYSSIESKAINMSQKLGARISLAVWCDTEVAPADQPYDYLILKVFDGTSWNYLEGYHETRMEGWYGNQSITVNNFKGVLYEDFFDITNFMSSNTKIGFDWNTDESNLDGAHKGCFVDNIIVEVDDDGSNEIYSFYNGTSMAAPHVAGLAALIEGARPDFNYTQVKNTILTTGDSLSSLNGKTVTGKRINAFNALSSVTAVSKYSVSGYVKYYDGVKNVSNATVSLKEMNTNVILATTTTNGTGFYEFKDVEGGKGYSIEVVRDEKSVNGVNVLDLIKINRYIVGLENWNSEIFKIVASDVNNTNSVNVLDLIKINRYIVGLENLISGNWKFFNSDSVITKTNYLTEGKVRTINSLNSNLVNQNFVGVRMGDVNNTWINN